MGEEEPTYMSCTIWKDRAAFEGWKNGNTFKEAHGEKKEGGEEEKAKKPLWSKPPVPVFYEGALVISSPEGA
jgi:heme-degrading monooxygenase HmoA